MSTEQTTTPDQGWHDAGLAVLRTWERYRSAATPLDAASELVEMNNVMSDLATYLPGYDYNIGTVRETDDDD